METAALRLFSCIYSHKITGKSGRKENILTHSLFSFACFLFVSTHSLIIFLWVQYIFEFVIHKNSMVQNVSINWCKIYWGKKNSPLAYNCSSLNVVRSRLKIFPAMWICGQVGMLHLHLCEKDIVKIMIFVS